MPGKGVALKGIEVGGAIAVKAVGPAAVQINGVVKKFGDIAAVDKVNLEIEAGAIFGLLGPNGAGKSTIINLICGLLKPDEGRITILGEEVRRLPRVTKQNIGIVPQEIAIYEDLTAFENVRFFAGLYGLRGAELKARTEEALTFVGLCDQAKQFPARFSGGMKRRLNIACALAHRPKLIIMDEPTVGIDPQSRNHILQSVRQLNEMGCTIVYTSHYMEEVEALCKRVAILDHGKIIADGTIPELKTIIANTNKLLLSVEPGVEIERQGLEEIRGVVGVEMDGQRLAITSSNDVQNLDRILAYFFDRKIAIRKIENQSPDLETVFLTLTGRKLRDAE